MAGTSDGELVSVVSLFQMLHARGTEAQFRKFATKKEWQRRGCGTALLAHVTREAREAGATKMLCNARVEQARFYSRRAFAESQQRFERAGKKYVVMGMALAEAGPGAKPFTKPRDFNLKI